MDGVHGRTKEKRLYIGAFSYAIATDTSLIASVVVDMVAIPARTASNVL